MSDNAPTAAAAPVAAAPPPHAQIVQMTLAIVAARALYAVAELGIPDVLADGPRPAGDIAAATGTHPRAVARLMRLMTSLGFFSEDRQGRFAVTDLGAALQSGAPGYLRSMVRSLAGPMSWGAWSEFLHSMRTEEPAMNKAWQEPIFEYLASRPEEAARFNETMISFHSFHGDESAAIAAAYDFSAMRRVVDVGGGVGALLTTILAANPGLSGVLFDLPHVAAAAREAIAAKGLADRCTVAAGSFFDTPLPAGADAYLLSHIIHDWDEARTAAILQNVRRAMQGRGKLLLVELVIPPGSEFHPGKMLDLIMLTFTGGRERTAEEYAALYASAGFRMTRVVHTTSAASVIEGEPV